MRLSLLCASTIFICFSPLAQAQSGGDGGDAFVNAYVTAQQGEKAETAGNFKLALSKLRQAAKDLETISTRYPGWSPTIVKYRKERTAEAIVRVQEKLAHFGPGKGGDAGPESGLPEPRLPEDGPLQFDKGPLEIVPPDSGSNPPPITESVAPQRNSRGRKSPASSNDDGDVSGELGKVERRLKDLQSQLANATNELERTRAEKQSVANKLDEAEKARRESDRKQEVLAKRAELAEKALTEATKQNNANAEEIMVRQKELNDAKKQLSKAKIEAEGDAEYRRELDDRYKAQLARITVLMKERDDAKSLNTTAPAKIEAIQKQLDAAKKDKEALTLKLQRMETQLTEVSKQRDDALAQVSKLKEAQKQVDKLVADNASLMEKLADAQKSVAQFKTEGVEKDKQIADLKKEVNSVKKQLEDTKTQSAAYQKQMGDLQAKLEETGKQLAEAKTENTETAAEKKKMQEENKILREIVLREQRKEADRQAMKKVVLGELAKLEINSKTLLKQIDFLSEPTLKLTAKERALFKKPELQVSDTEISLALTPADAIQPPGPVNSEISVADDPKTSAAKTPEVKQQEPIVSTTAPAPAPATPAPVPTIAAAPAPAATPTPAAAQKPPKSEQPKVAKNDDSRKPPISLNPLQPASTPFTLASNTATASSLFDAKPPQSAPPPSVSQAAPPPPDMPAKNVDESTPPLVTPDTAPNTTSTPPVPPEFIPLARQGKEQFERGNYLEAEKSYRKILAKAPRNLYTLSNLGVVLFRSGKLKLSEEMFNKAIAVAPEDGFSHCTLGIVYYQEQKLDEAVNELTKALAINPKNPTAHNYLGITASQKGWPEAAEKELETAVSLDSNYADAYFNLAVVFATQQPPNKEEARKCYKRAVELGAEPDAALEQLIK